MHKTTQSAKTIKPQTNIIPFPNRTKIVNQTITSTHLQRKEQPSKAATQDKNDDSSLIFEMLLVLKEQLDSLQGQLNCLGK